MKKLLSLFLILIFSVTAYAVTFTDLDGYDWASEAIYTLTEKGIINGMGDGTYAPEENVTREQIAKLVMGEFKGESQAIDFEDMTPDMWSYNAVLKTSSLFSHDGVNFYPSKDATREETALVITKAIFGDVLEKIKPSDTIFSDIDSIGEEKTVLKAVTLGIVTGYPDGTFRSLDNVTRAECAVMLHRALNEKGKYEVKDEPTPEVEKPENNEVIGTLDDLDARSEFFVVSSVSKIAEDDAQGIKGIYNGKEYSIELHEGNIKNVFNTDENTVRKGDVLQIVKNSRNDILKAYVVFSPSDVYEGDYVVNPVSDRSKIVINTSKRQDYAYGLVRNLSGNKLTLTFDNLDSLNDGAELFKLEDVANVYVFSNNKVYKGDENDIMYDKYVGENAYSEDASFVFLRATDNKVTDIYVIENK